MANEVEHPYAELARRREEAYEAMRAALLRIRDDKDHIAVEWCEECHKEFVRALVLAEQADA